MPELTGAQALVQSLQRHGVDTVFGLPGYQTYHFFDALHGARDLVRVIHARHEQAIAYMAYGYARSTGRAGVYSVVPGPGLLNSTAALCTAYAANAPVVCIAGQVPSKWVDRGVGFLHEIPDQLGLVRHLTKWAARIDAPAKAPRLVREAFRQMFTGRVRPVALEMPMDIMAAKAPVTLLDPEDPPEAPGPDPDLVEEAGRLLGRAQNPLIVYGGGAMDAGAELMEVAQLLQAPATTLWSGKGILDERHYLSQPYAAGHRFWAKADVVLAVGTRLDFPQLQWGVDGDLRIIRIDIDPEEPARIRPPAFALVADARAALRALIPAIARHNRRRPSREEELSAIKAAMFAEFERNVAPQMRILRVIREELPDDGFFVDEVTQVGYVSWYGFPAYAPRRFITSSYQGNLGYGYATALGVQAAHPDSKVISIGGDGGFMYQSQELATAVRYGLNVVNIVFTNDAYGNVRRDQQELFGGRVIASDLCNPDFVRYAESFGVAAFRADGPEELRQALRRAFSCGAPALIEMKLFDAPSPWPYIMLPRCRGG